MKIGISNSAARAKWGEERYKRLKALGFDCYDFGMMNTDGPWYTLDDESFVEALLNEKRLADEAGISIWQVHGPWRYPPADATEEDRAERIEKMQRSIRAAAILGAKYWVVHPIMPCGTSDIVTGGAEQTWQLNLKFMRELLKTAKAENVIICLENMPFVNFSLSTPSDILSLIKEINDPHFAMCLDTGHSNIYADWPPARAMRECGEYVKALHVHDNRGHNDEHLLPFFGTTDWKDFSAALAEVGFDGVVSLECAPSASLPTEIFDDMCASYAKVARFIAEHNKSHT